MVFCTILFSSDAHTRAFGIETLFVAIAIVAAFGIVAGLANLTPAVARDNVSMTMGDNATMGNMTGRNMTMGDNMTMGG
jgi:hypothetical protein